jgi:hypothetical protein
MKSIFNLEIIEEMGVVSLKHKHPNMCDEGCLELVREDIEELMDFLKANYDKIASRNDL